MTFRDEFEFRASNGNKYTVEVDGVHDEDGEVVEASYTLYNARGDQLSYDDEGYTELLEELMDTHHTLKSG